MLVKYNGVELPDLPQGVLEDYPYVFIRKDNNSKCYDLSLSNRILYYSPSQSRLNFPSGTAKWYQIPFSATIDENTEWNFKNTYYGDDYWMLDSNRTLVWSMFDIPSGSVTSTTIYFAGSPIEYPAIKKYLVRDNGTIYTVTEGALAEVTGELTASLFQTSGVDTIPDGTLLIPLTAPEVLCWTDSDTVLTLTATVHGTPLPQTIITNDIDISDESITGIEKLTAEYTGNPTVACSFDGGTTWKLYNGSAWVVLSENETGMTMETLLAITTENWIQILQGLTSFKMRFTLSTTDDTVTNIVINFTN